MEIHEIHGPKNEMELVELAAPPVRESVFFSLPDSVRVNPMVYGRYTVTSSCFF